MCLKKRLDHRNAAPDDNLAQRMTLKARQIENGQNFIYLSKQIKTKNVMFKYRANIDYCHIGKLEQNKHENFIPAYLRQEDVTNGTLAIAVHKTNIQITCLL